MRSAPIVLTFMGLVLVGSSHVAMQRRLTSIEATLRIALEHREERREEAVSSRRALSNTNPGVDLTALLASCRAEATASMVRTEVMEAGAAAPTGPAPESEEIADARIEADALLESSLASGRLSTLSAATLHELYAKLPSDDVTRIRVALAHAVNTGRLVPDEISSL